MNISKHNEISDVHKRDYPLTVLLPVVLEYIYNSKIIITIESDDEKPSHHELIPILRSYQECSNSLNSDMENLCPTWQGEYNDISHLNTCSIDNIISLISLSQEMIENAIKLSGYFIKYGCRTVSLTNISPPV